MLTSNISPIFRATSSALVQARRPRSIDPHFLFSGIPNRLGAEGPNIGQKCGPIAKLGCSGLEIGAFNSACKSVKLVSFCRTCPGMSRLARTTQATQRS